MAEVFTKRPDPEVRDNIELIIVAREAGIPISADVVRTLERMHDKTITAQIIYRLAEMTREIEALKARVAELEPDKT